MPHPCADLVDAHRREVGRRPDAVTASAHDGGPDAAVDLLDDSGADQIAISAIASELADLSDVLEVEDLEGTVVPDALHPIT